MTTDRELLELAAKAAGLRVRTWEWHSGARCAIDDDRHGLMWMPLTDDGDALRLAVKTGVPFVVRSRCVTTMGGLKEDFDPAVSGDDLRATRRAIVRAAAAIGKAMK